MRDGFIEPVFMDVVFDIRRKDVSDGKTGGATPADVGGGDVEEPAADERNFVGE